MTLPWAAEIGRFVHFSNEPELKPEIRRLVVTGGPRGLYTYKIERDARYPFAADRPYAHVLRGIGRELDAGTYTESDLERDLAKLRRIVDLAPAERALARQAAKPQRMLGDVYVQVPAGRLYYLITRQQQHPDPEDPPQWSNGHSVADPAYATELFRALGYDYVTDRFGMIYSSEPTQTVFLHPGAFKVEKTMKLHDRGPVRLSMTQNPKVSRPSRDELEDEQDPERRQFVAASADRIRTAAGELVSEGLGFGNKVWIVDVAERLGVPVLRLAPILIRMHRMGLVELQRRDLGVADLAKKAASEIEYEGIGTFHYVVAGPKKNPGPETIGFSDARDTISGPNPMAKFNAFDGDWTKVGKALREHFPGASLVDANLYFSRLRPLFGLRIPGLVPLFDRWGASLEPLTPAEVVKFELVPVGRAMGWFMFDCGIALKKTLEYTKVAMPEDGFDARVVFLNPRGVWQSSWFEDGVGPTGHNENDDPVTLLTEVWRDGFRHWAPGAIDMIGERLSDVAELEANPPPPPKPLRAPPPKKLPPKDKEETDEEIYQREFWKKELWDLEHEGMEDNPSQPRRMAHGAADALLNANKATILAYVQNVLCLHLTSKAAAKSVPFQRAIQLLPKVAAGKRTAHQHYGCGVYGCVMPTSVAGVVVKVTSDPSEPELVDLVKSRLKHWPEGLAAYYGTLKLPETYRGRPTFVLWREEAFHVGELEKLIHESTPAKARPLIALRRRLLQHLHYAAYARYTLKKSSYAPALLKDAEQLLPWARTTVRWADIEEATDQESDVLEEHRGARKLALCLVASQLISEMMVSDCGLAGAAIGKAFVQLRGVGILLADVHDSNIGVVDGRWVITDPGHAVVLR
jgi:hypothetical protein